MLKYLEPVRLAAEDIRRDLEEERVLSAVASSTWGMATCKPTCKAKRHKRRRCPRKKKQVNRQKPTKTER